MRVAVRDATSAMSACDGVSSSAPSMRGSASGMICHDTPNRSVARKAIELPNSTESKGARRRWSGRVLPTNPCGAAERRRSAELLRVAPGAGHSSALGEALTDASPLPEPQHQLLGHAHLRVLDRWRFAARGHAPRASGCSPRASWRSLGPAHRTRAARAGLDVGGEDMREQPRPAVARRRRVVPLAEQLELIAARGRGLVRGRVARGRRDDAPAPRRVARQDAEVAEQMESWRRHRGDQTRDDVRGLGHERARAVPPRPLEAELELAVRAALEAVLRDGRACNVLAEPLHSPAIPAVHDLHGVDVDAADLGDGLVGRVDDGLVGRVDGARARGWLRRRDESERRLAGAVSADRDAPGRSGVAGCSRPGSSRARSGGEPSSSLGVEAPSVRAQDLLDACRRA